MQADRGADLDFLVGKSGAHVAREKSRLGPWTRGQVNTLFAFGFGLERMAALMYNIDDIRHMFENDVRFLRQFTSAL